MPRTAILSTKTICVCEIEEIIEELAVNRQMDYIESQLQE